MIAKYKTGKYGGGHIRIDELDKELIEDLHKNVGETRAIVYYDDDKNIVVISLFEKIDDALDLCNNVTITGNLTISGNEGGYISVDPTDAGTFPTSISYEFGTSKYVDPSAKNGEIEIESELKDTKWMEAWAESVKDEEECDRLLNTERIDVPEDTSDKLNLLKEILESMEYEEIAIAEEIFNDIWEDDDDIIYDPTIDDDDDD